MSDELISGLSMNDAGMRDATSVSANKISRDDLQLKEACAEFEGMLTAIILKQGLMSQDDDAPKGNNVMKEFAVEQTAREMGRMGAMGIADMLYEQFILGGLRK